MIKRKNTVFLDGTWQFMLDKDNSGGEKSFMLSRCDTSDWRDATLPCTFEAAAPECGGYRGTVWFRREFLVDAVGDELVWLRFLCVNYRADVFINDHFAGTHIGGYLPFTLEISKFLRQGEKNLLCVRVNNNIVPGMLPPSHFWRGHGGILRSILLYKTPKAYIGNIKAVKCDDKVKLSSLIRNDGADSVTMTVTYSCEEADICVTDTVTVPSSGETVSTVFVPSSSFTLWDTKNPVMYTLKATAEADGFSDSAVTDFGVRDISAHDGKIYLNGKEITLRGVNRHEDSPTGMLATDTANSERDFALIKKMNANFVRFCHYPHSEEELDICDRLGLLVLSEIPLNATMVKIKEYDETETRRALPQLYLNAKNALYEMIERDYNHPSIIFWSVSNETEEREQKIRDMNNSLIRFAKKFDPSRFAVHVSQGCHWDGKHEIDDPLFVYDDVICVNSYTVLEFSGRKKSIDDSFKNHAQAFWDKQLEKFNELYPGKPVVVTEFGFPTDRIFDGPDDEQMQTDAVLCEISAMEKRVAGYAIWHFADHSWEKAEDDSVFFGAYDSSYGLFRKDRTEKKSVKYISACFKVLDNENS